MVQRLVAVARARKQRFPVAADARRLVDRQLLLERHVQAHVQKRIGLVHVVAVAVAPGIGEHPVVFGMLEDHLEGEAFHAGERPWGVECDVALPCATQNELNGDEARTLVANGCIAVSEGANMPTNLEGVHVFRAAKMLYAPGKASNAGGVAVSGLEMSQNSARISWKEAELQQLLRDIMDGIHTRCLEYGDRGNGYVDYVKGANIAGFKKVADAMLAFGVV